MIKGLVSSIVLNWNGKDIILPCLDSLLGQDYSLHEIILVDNASTDGSLQLIEEHYGHAVKIIRNPQNFGFAEGVNVGINNSAGEFIALLNSDATVAKNWLAELVKKIQPSEKIGMCASKVYLADHPGVLDNTGELLCRDGLSRARGRLERDRNQYDHSDEVLCPSGCAALYRRKIFDEAGLFDKYFFAYGDDMDIGLRGRMLGYKAVYVRDAIAFHKLSASAGVISPLKAYYVERNRLWVAIKCFPLKYLLAAPFYTLQRYFFHFCGIFSKKGPAAQFTQQFSFWQLLWITFKGYFSTLFFLPHLLTERQRLKKISKWSSADFENCFRQYSISARDAALNEVL